MEMEELWIKIHKDAERFKDELPACLKIRCLPSQLSETPEIPRLADTLLVSIYSEMLGLDPDQELVGMTCDHHRNLVPVNQRPRFAIRFEYKRTAFICTIRNSTE
jgi:hypothetical protein